MPSRSAAKRFPVRGAVPGALERYDPAQWQQIERIAKAIRALGKDPLSQDQAQQLAQQFGVHWTSIYRYRNRLEELDTASAIAGRKRGWNPLVSRLLPQQDEAIEQAIKVMIKKPGPLRVVDLVEEVAVACRLKQVPCRLVRRLIGG
jgi:putative transposase